MRLTWKLALNLLTVVALGVVSVGWVVTEIVGSAGFVDKPFKVTVDFAGSGGVFSNQEVTYRGVLVGKVGDMKLNEDGVNIQLLIDPEWEGKIPADVTAQVQSKSAVGEQFVNLTPRSSSGPMLRNGSKIARSNTRLPVDFQQLMQSLDSVLSDVPPGETRRLVKNLADGLGGREAEISSIIASLARLSKTFADTIPEQTRLLDNSGKAGDAFLRSKRDFIAAITAADKVFAGIGDEPKELEALFRQNDKFAREAMGLIRRQSSNFLTGIDGLADLTEFQLENKEVLIEDSLTYVPQFLRAIEEASVPWRDPDTGNEFYRIRAGFVLDNVPESWPCAYENPENYERQPHVRDRRKVDTKMKCEVPDTTAAAARELAAALQAWSSQDPALLEQRLAFLRSGGIDAETSGFIWPLDGAVTSPFGPRWGRMHTGIDIDGVTGEPIAASAAGRVTLATYYSGYGNAVIVDHGNGFATLYAHMSAIGVSQGDIVRQGQFLGAVGCTGHCFGDHLHFEIRIDGNAVDPLPYLTGSYSIFGEKAADVAETVSDTIDVPDPKTPADEDEAPQERPKKGSGETEAPSETEVPDVKAPKQDPVATKDWSELSEPLHPPPAGEPGAELPISYD